jgi:hypothetical protein
MICTAQYVPDPNRTPMINITQNRVSGDWAVFGNACAGCASYYFKITRTQNFILAEDGRYYYYYFFWFYSNSYYGSGQPASTYLTNVNAYLNNDHIINVPYILSTHQVNYAIWVRGAAGTPYFHIDKISVY